MSSFNILIAEIACPSCGNKSQVRIQFKFGNTWQLKYRVGDIITWGGNDTGSPNLGQVKVYGIIESSTCPFCKKNAIPEEYDILVVNNEITSVTPLVEIQDYLKGNGEFVIL
ncbi:hypothetical protein [Flavihumibacter profundi]|jgi:hypothetical protein|uniref:hypothetical protein n=1 Tax=Flavihumibacter profundi TaxID=2716883 RepID=UPI001CC3522A|nr:hypothetical protein [Flavihumibacter profundi]MBZ5858558.1 hypothetical protein [Flavihumibacter profundi]